MRINPAKRVECEGGREGGPAVTCDHLVNRLRESRADQLGGRLPRVVLRREQQRRTDKELSGATVQAGCALKQKNSHDGFIKICVVRTCSPADLKYAHRTQYSLSAEAVRCRTAMSFSTCRRPRSEAHHASALKRLRRGL